MSSLVSDSNTALHYSSTAS